MHLKFKFPTGSIDFLLHILRMSQRFIIKSVSQAAQPFFWYKWTKIFRLEPKFPTGPNPFPTNRVGRVGYFLRTCSHDNTDKGNCTPRFVVSN